MSFFTALLAGLGGYGAGKQQATQNQLAQRQLTDEEQYRQRQAALQAAQERTTQEQALRARGIDPATAQWDPNAYQFTGGQPFKPLADETRVVPGKVGTHYQVTPQDLIAHYTRLASGYAEEGRTDKANLYANLAAGAQTEVLRAQSEAATFNRELVLTGLRNNLELNRMDKSENATLQRTLLGEAEIARRQGLTQDYETWKTQITQANQAVQSDRRDISGLTGALSTSLGKLNGANTAASQGKTTKNAQGQVVPLNQVNPNMGGWKSDVNQTVHSILTAPDPEKAAQTAIDGVSKHAGYSQDQIGEAIDLFQRAGDAASRYREDTRGLQDLYHQRPSAATGGGGSDAGGNPTSSGGKIPPRKIWDMVRAAGATPEEATTLTAIALAESGGDPGSINPHDPLGNGQFQHAWGLFQLGNGTNDPNAYPGWQDPQTNIRYALEKLRSQGYGAWGTYNTKAYRQYLPQGAVANQ